MKHTVLSVDDDPASQDMLERAFRKCEIPSPIKAFSGEEGLALLNDEKYSPIKLILLDLNLPTMSGFDFLAALRRSPHQLLPVIVFSTSTNSNDIVKSYSLGANAYICKPPGYIELIEIMKKVSELFLSCIQLPDIGLEPPAKFKPDS